MIQKFENMKTDPLEPLKTAVYIYHGLTLSKPESKVVSIKHENESYCAVNFHVVLFIVLYKVAPTLSLYMNP